MKHWSTALVIVIVIGASILKGINARKQKEEQRGIQKNDVLQRQQRSRRGLDEQSETLSNLERASTVPFKLFSVSLNDSTEDLVDFNEEILWKNGSHFSTRIPLPNIDLQSEINESQLQHVVERVTVYDSKKSFPKKSSSLNSVSSSKHHQFWKHRTKRIIFKPDNRIRLNASTQAQKFPFSSSVKISSGCSGSLISSTHVLTSAHCLHNGKKLLTPISNLKVGFLRRNGHLRWIGVRNVKFPERWQQQPDSPSFDYAVITLRRAHRRPFFKLGVIETSRQLKPSIHFASFPGDKKPNSLWYSHCRSQLVSSLLICRCDATTGSSGAGTYVTTTLKGRHRVLVGILSSSGRVTLPDGRKKLFNLITRLTHFKARQICRWIGSPTNCTGTSGNVVRLRSP